MFAESTSFGRDNIPEMPDTLLKLGSSPWTQNQDHPVENTNLYNNFMELVTQRDHPGSGSEILQGTNSVFRPTAMKEAGWSKRLAGHKPYISLLYL